MNNINVRESYIQARSDLYSDLYTAYIVRSPVRPFVPQQLARPRSAFHPLVALVIAENPLPIWIECG